MMVGQKSFEQMGREADEALRAAATAKDHVIRTGSAAAMARRIRVEIEGADWENGLFHLRDHLTAVVQEQIENLLPAAVKRMEDKAKDGIEALRLAFEAGEHRDAGPHELRQVPRLDEVRSTFVDGQALADATDGRAPTGALTDEARAARLGTGFTDPHQVMEHDQSVDGTPPAPSAQAAGTAAPSGPVGQTPAPATTRRLQPSDFLAPFTLGNSQLVLDRQEAELFEQVASGNMKVPARGPQATKLVNYGLVEKTDRTASAVLRLTSAGQVWIAALQDQTA